MIAVLEGTFRVQTTARSPLVVSADGGVISHAGSRLLADLADRTTLTSELAEALAQLGRPRAVHEPGRVLVDLAVAVADGAECISDIAVLGDQRELFGSVASDSTVWRLLDQLEESELAAIAAARAAAREVAWAQRPEVTAAAVPAATAAGADLPGLVIDVDASRASSCDLVSSSGTGGRPGNAIEQYPFANLWAPGTRAASLGCRLAWRGPG